MKKQERRKISDNLKRKIAMEVIKGYLSKEAARRVYGIKGKSAITDWVRFYSDGQEITTQNDAPLPSMTPQEREKFKELQAKIALLEEQLTNETHRAGLYKTMIEIAEEQLNIPIRKKYGARQLNNTKSTKKK